MSYLWQEFNIKTFPAETLVFRDGVFCEDLSDYESAEFDANENTISVVKTPTQPIHIILIGEITGKFDINIVILPGNTDVFMTAKIFNKKPAFLNFFIKNTGKNSIFNGQIIAQNYNSLKIDVKAGHFCENTGIFVKTKVLAHENTETDLSGCADIENNAVESDSDVSFSVMAVDESAKIIMKPMQYIKSVPHGAKHSASIYKNNEFQVDYLRGAGLSGEEIKQVFQEAFLSQE